MHAQDLAKAFKERYEGKVCRPLTRKLECFLDRDDSGDLHNLVDIVGRSRCLMLFLTRDVLDSPWCMLELLSAVMNEVPIVLLKVEGHSMRDVGFPGKLEEMGFPGADQIKAIKVVNHSRDYFEACVDVVSERFARHITDRPSPHPRVPSREVHEAFEKLRRRRNSKFRSLEKWTPL